MAVTTSPASTIASLPPRLAVSERRAAQLIGCSSTHMARIRKREIKGLTPPPHVRLGARILYRVGDLDAWLEARLT